MLFEGGILSIKGKVLRGKGCVIPVMLNTYPYPLMQKTCAKCSASFEIHADEEAFLKKVAFRYGKTEFHPPLPVHCPDCRCQIRTCHRNENNLFKIKSAKSGKEIVALY